jgi:hypothetical protein
MGSQFGHSDFGFHLLSAQCIVSGVNSPVFTASAVGLPSPFTAHRTKKPNGCCGKSVIDSLLRGPWEPFAAPNAERKTVLQISGANSCSSARSAVCMSVVAKVLCALSSGEIAFEEKTVRAG